MIEIGFVASCSGVLEQVFVSEPLPYLPGFSEDAKLHERAKIWALRKL